VWTICEDTVANGFQPVLEEDKNGVTSPVSFNSRSDALREIEADRYFYDGCFVCKMDEVGHKTVV